MKTALISKSEVPALDSRPVLRTALQKSVSHAPARPAVSVLGYQYRVDLGEDESPRYHRVSKDKTCSCGAPCCEAIEAVRQYLQAGGIRAPEPVSPVACPICGAKALPDPRWDGKYTRTPGWRCQAGGLSHFLQAKAQRIQKNLADNPWLIPPADGYPGVRRDEVLTWEECEAINRRLLEETGYDPTA